MSERGFPLSQERRKKAREENQKKKEPEKNSSYLCTRVGAALASLTAIIPPMECPTRCADFQPTAS